MRESGLVAIFACVGFCISFLFYFLFSLAPFSWACIWPEDRKGGRTCRIHNRITTTTPPQAWWGKPPTRRNGVPRARPTPTAGILALLRGHLPRRCTNNNSSSTGPRCNNKQPCTRYAPLCGGR
jgi:hypothetical protein